MVFLVLLALAAAFVAFANGANDNFKGVATLFGGGLTSYRRALGWATVTTLGGSLASVVLAQGILHKFSGMGFVPAALTDSSAFALAVALGAAATVIAATRFGFPVSTTHALLGALGGAGWATAGVGALKFGALAHGFLYPLLLSPVLAIGLGGALYLMFAAVRRLPWASKPVCVCVDPAPSSQVLVGAVAAGLTAPAPPIEVAVLSAAECAADRPGVMALDTRQLSNGLHWASAGAVSFARGVNDTPKIAALLLGARLFTSLSAIGLVAVAIAVGGLLAARRVADTMSNRITSLDPVEGLASNLSTATLVLGASLFGLPVSTTHVAVGSLFGIGLTTRGANLRKIGEIVLSWVLTLPCAAAAGALTYLVLRPLAA